MCGPSLINRAAFAFQKTTGLFELFQMEMTRGFLAVLTGEGLSGEPKVFGETLAILQSEVNVAVTAARDAATARALTFESDAFIPKGFGHDACWTLIQKLLGEIEQLI